MFIDYFPPKIRKVIALQRRPIFGALCRPDIHSGPENALPHYLLNSSVRKNRFKYLLVCGIPTKLDTNEHAVLGGIGVKAGLIPVI